MPVAPPGEELLEADRDVPMARPIALLLALASGRAAALSGRVLSVRDDLAAALDRVAEWSARYNAPQPARRGHAVALRTFGIGARPQLALDHDLWESMRGAARWTRRGLLQAMPPRWSSTSTRA